MKTRCGRGGDGGVGSCRDEKGTFKAALPVKVVPGTRSQDEKGICKAALPLEVVPGARYVRFFLLSYYCWALY